MRVSLQTYLSSRKGKVYSLVADVPFSPIDLELGLLARGEWDSVKDRFRIWFLPKIEGQNDTALCYVTIRKLDQEQDVLVYMQVVVNLGAKAEEDGGQHNFTVGILSNDDVRARATLGVMLGIPPVFHKRSEIRLVEGRWRDDSETLARFTANVVSATTARLDPGGKVHSLNAQLPPDFLSRLKGNLGSWWETSEDRDSPEG